MGPIRVVIADDHPVVRDGLRRILELGPSDANWEATYDKQPLAFGPDEVGSHPHLAEATHTVITTRSLVSAVDAIPVSAAASRRWTEPKR